MTSDNTLTIDERRLWDTVMRSGEIGPGRDQGLRRLALDASDGEMRDLFVAWCEAAGLAVTVDAMGSIFARRAGRENDLPPVVIGSHLDTQYTGGKFDGILGVLGGLEVLRTLNDRGIETRRPLEVVDWSNEEGARFNPPMMASAVFAGIQTLAWGLARTDLDGVSFADALAEIGYAGEAPVGGREIDSYFELHIEQGPLLEAAGVPVGVVTGGFATRGMRIRITGETAHTGPTPMDKRKNALVGAGYVIAAVNDIGWAHHAAGAKATSSQIEIWPNATGILPEHAMLTVDFRHPEQAGAERMREEVLAALDASAVKGNVEIEVAETWRFGDEIFDADCTERVRQAARDLAIPFMEMQSQAGHDAYNMTHVCPTALIFCPCEDGIIHNEAENVTLEDAAPSVNVLLHAVLSRAER